MHKLIPISDFCTTATNNFSNRSALSYPEFTDAETARGKDSTVLFATDFTTSIRREFVQESAIDAELFAASIEIIEDTGRWEPNEALNHRVATQWKTRQPHNFGAIAAFKNENESTWQAKPKYARYDVQKAKPQKYETSIGHGARAFLPAVTVRTWYAIAQRYKSEDRLPVWVKTAYQNGNLTLKSGSKGFGVTAEESSFWQWVEQIETLRIVLTEGGKKSLCLLSHGDVAIALYGVNSGVSAYDRITGEKIRKLKPELIPDLQRFAVSGRQFVLAFDQDAKFETRQKVAAALGQLGALLVQSGCEVEIAQWDGRDGKGIDDLIVNCGVQAWEKSRSEAVSFSQWSIMRQLAREVRRKPDLNIKDREFIEVASELPREGIIALYGTKGSGKSKAIGQLLKDQKWLSLCHSIAVGRDQAAGWGGVFVNDGDRHGSKLLKDGVPVDGISVCVPSVLKLSAFQPGVFVLDETTASLEFLLESRLANKQGIRSLLIAEFIQKIRSARLVLIADADLTEEALRFIESIRGERAYLVKSERKALTYEATIIDDSKNAAIALLQERIDQAPEDKIIYLNCDSKALAEAFSEILGRDKTLLITSETSGGEVEASFLASKGRDLPRLIASGIRFIVSSPSITQGFSIEHHTDLIDSVWGFYSGCSISVQSMAQALDRVRSSKVPRFIWVAKKGSAYSRLGKAHTVSAFLKEFKQLNSTAARLVRNSLIPDTEIEVDRLDWQSQNLQMLASLEVRRNRGMGALRETLIALLTKEGKRITIVKPNFSKAQLQATGNAIRTATDAVNDRHCKAVEAATDLTQEQADRLSTQSEPLTPEQVLSLDKFYICQFYRLETATVADIKYDRNGRTKTQIKALESILNPEVATETTAKSINLNSENPQDWNPIAVGTWLLEQSGAAKLIRGIKTGEVNSLTSDLVAPIVEFVRSHSTEFRIAFKIRDVSKMSDQQIMGEILTRHKIKTKRRGNKNNLRYEVCKPELEKVLEIIERRRVGIAPIEELKEDQRGAIPLKPPKIEISEADLADIRDLYQAADTPEAKEAIKKLYSIEIWRQAIDQSA